MYKYLLIMLSINQTSALPIGIRISDFNIGLYGSKKLSEVPALVSLINYTLFKYSSYEREELEDIATLLDEHDFKTRYDSWQISEDSFYVLGFKEVSKENFELLRQLDLLNVADEYNYQNAFLSANGKHKIDEYFKDFNVSKEQEILNQFKAIAFSLNSDAKLDSEFFNNVIEILSLYKFGTALEEICTVNQIEKSRSYHSHTLEVEYGGCSIQVIFSNYKERGIKENYVVVEPINIEIMVNDEQCNDIDLSKILSECEYTLNLIKTDLYANTYT